MATLNPIGRTHERGQAIVELALTLPLLLLIVLGIFDFGIMFQRYELVTNAAREGARVAVLPGYSTTDAQNRALQYLDVGGLSVPTAGSCASDPPAGNRCASAASSTVVINGKTVQVRQVTVAYTHRYGLVSPIMGLFGSSLGNVTLKAVSSMRVE